VGMAILILILLAVIIALPFVLPGWGVIPAVLLFFVALVPLTVRANRVRRARSSDADMGPADRGRRFEAMIPHPEQNAREKGTLFPPPPEAR
jgi:membrane protein implicated in regulation of membrane protease activity